MIPKWNMAGILPPIRPNVAQTDQDRSPYQISLIDFVDHFSTSTERITILQGFLNYRQALHSLGVNDGFQWLDGSFVENIEQTEARSPNDIDVVTYFHMPNGGTQVSLYNQNPDIFSPNKSKSEYKVDGYLLELGNSIARNDISKIIYWYSLWSHTRSKVWKGFIQVDLNPKEDSDALKLLMSKLLTGGTP